ncbi:D-isomer specific 2-hydroxyacid dehydrogenase, NAD binding domain containing protein [Brugia malayi]|uniref:D-isomer specific 2-hydroxyacid dehydrogenase, NAD binding domain containing protein n=1 Tax=Brugia malayi TaxID=6279 RepID=A0A4E9FTB1_BRUMA|nr:D-isomer specific 2-hydroxyacid dehydrogenase, NAD binding domain containing protein [Brugia malayi]VIO97710.1 D-isomer specific 2-hydroxyacid dehydrogenase, NAD binding domain containing protein [Brugia malayi]
MVFTAAELPKFTTHPATFIPTVFGGHVLVYESRSHPGHRREFAFKTRFTNQSGVSSCYYRCMSCRSMKNKVPPGPDGKPPQIPCIAVKNGFIVNDPDFPEANDHFCIPPTLDESRQREANGFAKAIVKGRPRQKATRKNNTGGGIGNGSNLKKDSVIAAQLQAYQEMSNALLNGSAGNIFDISSIAGGFDLSSDFTASSASQLLSLVTGGVKGELDSAGDSSDFLNNIKIEDDDSDGTAKATHLLASLISSEPALRTQMMLPATAHRTNVLPLAIATSAIPTSSGGTEDEQLNSINGPDTRSSPESSTAVVINSLQNSDSRPPSVSSSSASVPLSGITVPTVLVNGLSTSSRKRKGNSGNSLENHFDEIFERYILNNWEIVDNGKRPENIAEHTCALILSLARKIPQAVASMKEGKWTRTEPYAEEIFGKSLAIIGLGRIGLEIAIRMQVFGMRTFGYDPQVTQEEAARHGIRWLPLDQLWPQADYIVIHVPLIPRTKNLLCASTLARCRKGVKIINMAKAGIMNEVDMLQALNKGRVGGAAFDVYVEDAPLVRGLVEHPNVICTPHMGTSPLQGHQRIANEIAENIVSLNNSTGPYGAMNAAAATAALDEAKSQWIRAVATLTQTLAVIGNSPRAVTVRFPNSLVSLQKALHAGAVVGLMYASGNIGSNLAAAEMNARKEGIQIREEPCAAKELIVVAGTRSVSGYPAPTGTIISAFNSCKVPVPLLASGTFIMDFSDSHSFDISDDDIKVKLIIYISNMPVLKKKKKTNKQTNF